MQAKRAVAAGSLPARRAWFSRSCFTKSDDKLPIVLLLKYYTYNRGATTQTLSAGGLGLIVAPGLLASTTLVFTSQVPYGPPAVYAQRCISAAAVA
jgi:hypothetical protein